MSDVETAKRLFLEALAFLDAQDDRSAELRLRDALNFAPRNLSILANLSAALMRQNKLEDALAVAERTRDIDPENIGALLVMANGYAQEKQHSAALETCDRIIALEPGLAEIHSNRAIALNGLRRCEEAVASCDRAIVLQPNLAGAHHNRGNALAQLRQYEQALLAYDKALLLKPDLVEAWIGRGNLFARQKRLDDALAAFDRATELSPDLASAWIARGNVLTEMRRFDDALSAFERAIECDPKRASAWLERGLVLGHARRFSEALDAFAKALALEADFVEALKERGNIHVQLGQYADAFADFDGAFTKKPELSYVEGERLHAKMHLCDWKNFDAECAHLLLSVASGRPATSPFALFAVPSSPADQRRCAQIYMADYFPASPTPLWHGERYAHERVRIAYLSTDFRDHPIALLTAGLFRQHDLSRFETTAISLTPGDSSLMRERLKGSFERFIDADTMSDLKVGRLVRGLEVDIAVDLNGFTSGSRPNIFAQRPAPLQVNYLGSAGTLGQGHWDYIVADRFVIPDGSEQHYVESIVRMPDAFIVNDADRKISDRIPSRAQCGLPGTGFVFCCFNNSFKITPDVFDIWMRLLGQVEGSVLWLSTPNAVASSNLRRESQARGVAPDRLVFAPKVASNADHLARLRLADLVVDTLYYNAHTTAIDALWAGVPVLTCSGTTFASRVAGSLLGAVGLPELITNSLVDYESLALSLARDPARLSTVKQRLAHNRRTHPLFDTARFTRHLEAAYTMMWERMQRGDPPRGFAVGAIEQADA
jgi:protein O-GlcNAc transferase